ncbi:hypothetical protein Lalb_Chr15g0085101 [Lupinus albus]|uniref:Uncharacterized protein n=1 Tax=Lupinus albus TaxID=3870 RepID=A0A6A4PCA1_LUPAL|nr:hypothetical protein Lalb_Chr15g0085101 [Lupinus albus]
MAAGSPMFIIYLVSECCLNFEQVSWHIYLSTLESQGQKLSCAMGICKIAPVETARGIGICAEFGGRNFGTIANVAISKLYSLIEDGRSVMGEETKSGAKMSDMAVSALGKICEFHCEYIDDPQVKIFHIKQLLGKQLFYAFIGFIVHDLRFIFVCGES